MKGLRYTYLQVHAVMMITAEPTWDLGDARAAHLDRVRFLFPDRVGGLPVDFFLNRTCLPAFTDRNFNTITLKMIVVFIKVLLGSF